MSTPITITGNLVEIPQLRHTARDRPFVRVRVAVSSRHQNASRQWVEGPTSWFTVIAWKSLAEHLAASASKGDTVLVHGRLEQRAYTTESGERREDFEVTAEEIGLSLRCCPVPSARAATASAACPR